MMSDRALALTEDPRDDYETTPFVVLDAAGGFICATTGAVDAYRAARSVTGARIVHDIPPAAGATHRLTR